MIVIVKNAEIKKLREELNNLTNGGHNEPTKIQ